MDTDICLLHVLQILSPRQLDAFLKTSYLLNAYYVLALTYIATNSCNTAN